MESETEAFEPEMTESSSAESLARVSTRFSGTSLRKLPFSTGSSPARLIRTAQLSPSIRLSRFPEPSSVTMLPSPPALRGASPF